MVTEDLAAGNLDLRHQSPALLAELEAQKDGAQGRNRTTDTRIFSPLLYRLSYLGAAGAPLY